MNFKSLKYSAFLLTLTLLFGCSDKIEVESNEPPVVVEEYVVPTILPDGDEKYLNTGSGYLFDQTSLHTFELKLSESSLSQLNNDPAAEQYVEGTLIFEGDTISPVGIRYKGSVGAFVNCVSGDNWANPSGYKTCTKLSMKVKINWEGREEKFYKQKKLQFHSQNLDPSQMHERLGYYLFREMGMAAPRSVHARLIVNDQYAGIFALTEQIDGRFVKHNYKDDDGNLYKEIWPLNFDGVPHKDWEYINALKTNENENPSVAIIRDFGQNIADATFSEARNIVESQMNLEEILSYIAVDRSIRHDDGPFHWYCFGNECSSHNFYFYEEPNNKILHLIPWDLDNAFENIIFDVNPVTPIADKIGETSNNCKPFKYSAFGLEQWSASCDKLTSIWASYETELAEKRAELFEGPMSKTNTDELLDSWSNQIRGATIEASELYGDAISESEWESALTQLKNQLDHARNN